jgi:hypothetical protein
MTALVVLGLVNTVSAEQTDPLAKTATQSRISPDERGLDGIVRAKLKFYSSHFPKIQFVWLKGGAGWIDDMVALSMLLGHKPVSLDYEHPKELAEDLLCVCVARIELMLRHRAASASLFRTGQEAFASRSNLCLITLDPEAVSADDATATAHLMDLSDKELAELPHAKYLNHEDHLRYVIDHEAYHCLDSFLNGPIPMSDKEYWGQYREYWNEIGADAYAVAMNVAAYGEVTAYARHITEIRGLSLLYGDPDHFTYRAMNRVINMDPEQLAGMSVRDVFKLATQVRDMVAPDYDAYVDYRAAACKAMNALGVEGEPFGEPDHELDADKINEMADAMVNDSRSCYKEMFGRPYGPSEDGG